MNKTFRWHPAILGIFMLILSGCFQSTPETPQQAVEEVLTTLSLAGTAWELESF